MDANVKPLYRRNVVIDEGNPVVFETDTGSLVVIPTVLEGKITLRYEFHPRIPQLTMEQRN